MIGSGSRGTELLGQGGDQGLRAGAAAHEVVADVQHPGCPRLEREQRVEGGDAVDVGGRDRQPPRDVVERAGADPSGVLVERVQRRQQLVALRAGGVAAVGGVPVLDPVRAGPLDIGGPRNASTAARSSVVGSASRRRRSTLPVDLAAGTRGLVDVAVQLVDADRRRLELRRARLRIGGVDRQHS